jgi:transcriptional regulator GlxA family with amidase domain
MPRGARLVAVAIAVAVGFIAVVLPLFSDSGAPHAEISGAVPETATAGVPLHVDIALDNVGDSIIYPVCVTLNGDGASLVSAVFQGLDRVAATGNRVCGGQLTGQETISIGLVFTLNHRGSTTLQLVPQQGSTVIGPAFSATVSVS